MYLEYTLINEIYIINTIVYYYILNYNIKYMYTIMYYIFFNSLLKTYTPEEMIINKPAKVQTSGKSLKK